MELLDKVLQFFYNHPFSAKGQRGAYDEETREWADERLTQVMAQIKEMETRGVHANPKHPEYGLYKIRCEMFEGYERQAELA